MDLWSMLEILDDLYGDKFWKSLTISVSFWEHSEREIKRRKYIQRRDEKSFTQYWNSQLKNHFPSIPTVPVVFIDPLYEEEWARDDGETDAALLPAAGGGRRHGDGRCLYLRVGSCNH